MDRPLKHVDVNCIGVQWQQYAEHLETQNERLKLIEQGQAEWQTEALREMKRVEAENERLKSELEAMPRLMHGPDIPEGYEWYHKGSWYDREGNSWAEDWPVFARPRPKRDIKQELMRLIDDNCAPDAATAIIERFPQILETGE